MPYDARYAAMSVRKRTYGNQGGTTGFMSRPFWDGTFFILCIERKEENDERKTAEHQRRSIKSN